MGFLCWLIVGVATTHTYGFYIPLDFLGIKDLKKIKRPKTILKALAKATDQFYRNFIIFLAYLDRFDIRIQPIEAI